MHRVYGNVVYRHSDFYDLVPLINLLMPCIE